MAKLSPSDIVTIFLSLGLLLLLARCLGEIAIRLNQPAVLGEILAGIVLGPTLFGRLAPEGFALIFPNQGAVAISLNAFTTVAISLYLLVAGLEVDLSVMWRQGRTMFRVSALGIAVPFALGFALGWWFLPPPAGGIGGDSGRLLFAFFMATALSISALPVIARTLMDLRMYRSDVGMVIMSSAVIVDLLGWIIFAVIISMIDTGTAQWISVEYTIALTLVYAILMLTVVRVAIDRLLPWIQAALSWPGGIMTFILSFALLGAAFTEWIGIHAVFGSFLFGVAAGDSAHLSKQIRLTLDRFISFFFAPLFFATIGLRVDFAAHFDAVLVLVVLAVATAGKVAGCALGARLGGMSRGASLAVGFGLNARGSMEIILGLVALQMGLIDERLFVALVIMALVTSMMSGPLMQFFLGRRRPHRFARYLSPRSFISPLLALDRRAVFTELIASLPLSRAARQEAVERIVMEREAVIFSGSGNGIAVTCGTLAGMTAPAVAVGVSHAGIDADAPDGLPVQLFFLVLTPDGDAEAQLDIVDDIAGIFENEIMRERAVMASGYAEFRTLVKTGPEE